MSLYQQIMFGLGVLLLIFGMFLMMFRSTDNGLTKIKLPVVELELNGGALFVMLLGAGLMFIANDRLDILPLGNTDKAAQEKHTAALPDQPADDRLKAAEEAKKAAEADTARQAAEESAKQSARKEEEDRIAAIERKLQNLDGKPQETPPAAQQGEQSANLNAPAESPAPSAGAGASLRSASLWGHNSSTIILVANGDQRKFYYDRPKPALVANGVHNGTLLFEGERRGSTYRGTAYVFSAGCAPLGFEVTGEVSAGDREVVLHGNAPKRRNCRVVDTVDTTLRFNYLKAVKDYRFSAGGE